jgi:hypothetical protein
VACEPEDIGDEPGREQKRTRDQKAEAVEELFGRQDPLVHLAARPHKGGEPLGAQHRHADHGGQDTDGNR